MVLINPQKHSIQEKVQNTDSTFSDNQNLSDSLDFVFSFEKWMISVAQLTGSVYSDSLNSVDLWTPLITIKH